MKITHYTWNKRNEKAPTIWRSGQNHFEIWQWSERKGNIAVWYRMINVLTYHIIPFFLESLRVDFLSHIHHIRSKCQRFKRNMANSMSCIPKRKVDSSVMWFYFPGIIIVLYPITFWQFYSGLMQTNQWKYYCQ